jgi:hypothetical protein
MSRLVVIIASLIFCGSTLARDFGQYSQVDPGIRDWVKSLKDGNGIPCCDTADGYDAEWDTHDDHYRVRINGIWYDVPERAVLSEPNRLRVPRVWYVERPDGEIYIRCFMPGAGG